MIAHRIAPLPQGAQWRTLHTCWHDGIVPPAVAQRLMRETVWTHLITRRTGPQHDRFVDLVAGLKGNPSASQLRRSWRALRCWAVEHGFGLPQVEALADVHGEALQPPAAQQFIPLLRAMGLDRVLAPLLEEHPGLAVRGTFLLLGTWIRGGRVSRLRLAPMPDGEHVAQPLLSDFSLGVRRFGEGYYVSRAAGRSALDVALAARNITTAHLAEREVLAARLGTYHYAAGAARRLTLGALRTYLADRGIQEMWRLARMLDPTLPKAPAALSLAGVVRSDQVIRGLRLLMETETDGLSESTMPFQIRLEPCSERFRVTRARGTHALDVGMAAAGIRASGDTEAVPCAVLAAAWQTESRGAHRNHPLRRRDLVHYLQTHGIQQLWDVRRMANPALPEDPRRLILIGRPETDRRISRLRLLTEAEAAAQGGNAEDPHGNVFRLTFEEVEGVRACVRAVGTWSDRFARAYRRFLSGRS